MITADLATLADAESISLILQEQLIDINNAQLSPDLGSRGFLIRNFSPKEIADLILDKTNLILVAKKKNEVIGYIIGGKLNNIPAELRNDALLSLLKAQSESLDDVLYYRQIAVRSANKNSGVGRILISRFLNFAKTSGYQNVVCRIVHQPINNEKSIAFHQKSGFNLIGIAKEKNVVAGVYILRINKAV